MAITGAIPLPTDPMSALFQGSTHTQNILNSIMENRLKAAQTEAQLAKNPYIGQQSAADLQNQLNINKYYAPNIESEIGLRKAQTGLTGEQAKWYGPKAQSEIGYQNLESALKRQLLENPGLGGSGIEHEIAVLNLLQQKHPELANQLRNEVIASSPGSDQTSPDQKPNLLQLAKNGMQQGQPGQPAFNPLDALKRSIESQITKNMSGGMGGRVGVSLQQQKQLQDDLKRDNPNLTDDQIFEAAGNLLSGNKKLNDGTPFNVSGLTQNNASKVALQGTTSALASKQVQANQADAEIKVFTKYANEGISPYGDTFMGMSPKQVADTFAKDKESQERLGKFIGAQALQYEIAQIRNRIAQGAPGITATRELMKESQQHINAKYPFLSEKARKQASDYIDNALSEGLEARNKVGISINTGYSPSKSEEKASSSEVKTTWIRDKNGKLVRAS